MIVRIRGEKQGGHVRARVFVGPSKYHTLALTGALMLDPDQWLMLEHFLRSADPALELDFVWEGTDGRP